MAHFFTEIFFALEWRRNSSALWEHEPQWETQTQNCEEKLPGWSNKVLAKLQGQWTRHCSVSPRDRLGCITASDCTFIWIFYHLAIMALSYIENGPYILTGIFPPIETQGTIADQTPRHKTIWRKVTTTAQTSNWCRRSYRRRKLKSWGSFIFCRPWRSPEGPLTRWMGKHSDSYLHRCRTFI